MEWLASPEIWVAFLTLTALEIVLGIDNIIFISILVSRLPAAQQPKARFFGLALAMGTRILLLLSITWVMRLTADLFEVFGQGVSGRDLILFFGGLFLLFKSTMEIYHSLEGAEEGGQGSARSRGFMAVIIQIAIIDIIFSLDSVITAVGLVQNVPVMIATADGAKAAEKLRSISLLLPLTRLLLLLLLLLHCLLLLLLLHCLLRCCCCSHRPSASRIGVRATVT